MLLGRGALASGVDLSIPQITQTLSKGSAIVMFQEVSFHPGERRRIKNILKKMEPEYWCKRVAKRTFEAHDLMLRSYYAVKFSSSTSVDFSRLLGNSFALQHCLRLPI